VLQYLQSFIRDNDSKIEINKQRHLGWVDNDPESQAKVRNNLETQYKVFTILLSTGSDYA